MKLNNNFATMDVNMLLSLVSMQLRDHYEDLDDLAGRRISTRPWSPGWPAAIFHYQEDRNGSDRDRITTRPMPLAPSAKAAKVVATRSVDVRKEVWIHLVVTDRG